MDSVIKCGPMIKRSQNKKKWSIVNYKNRWFELSRSFLVYFDHCEGGREVRVILLFHLLLFLTTSSLVNFLKTENYMFYFLLTMTLTNIN